MDAIADGGLFFDECLTFPDERLDLSKQGRGERPGIEFSFEGHASQDRGVGGIVFCFGVETSGKIADGGGHRNTEVLVVLREEEGKALIVDTRGFHEEPALQGGFFAT